MSYITVSRGQVLSGLGACGCGGCGCSGLGEAEAGGVVWSAAEVWAAWMNGQSCSQPGGDCEQAKIAVNMIRVALAKLGYGEQSLDAQWGAHDMASYKEWANGAGLTSNGMPLRDQLSVMETQLAAHKKPGPNPAVEYQYVPGSSSTFMESIGGGKTVAIVLAALAVGGLGYLAYRSKKHHGKVPHSPLTASAPT